MTGVKPEKVTMWQRMRRRGVLRVALSYLVIAWLILQIGDVVLDPLGAPPFAMRVLIVLTAVGFPAALLLAWFLEFTPSGIEVDHLEDGATRPAMRGIRHYADIVIIGGLLLVVALLLLRQEGLIPDDTLPPVVAVLPFEELDGSEDNHFGDGFADTLIQKLGMLDDVVVLASSSTFEFRGSGLELPEVAGKIGANVLLQGSLRRAGGLLRLDARLVNGSNHQQLWSGNYRRPLDDIFRVQDEITNAVASALDLQLSASQVERLARPPTNNLAAYDTFLRASRDALESRDWERITEARQYLYDAIELDPDFALAHATLVEALYLTASHRSLDTRWTDLAEEARRAAARAQALDPNLGEAYLAAAYVAHYDDRFGIREWPKADIKALAERALELNPNLARALKFLAGLEDDQERSLELVTRAAHIDPRSGIIALNAAEMASRLGQFDLAEQWSIRSAKATDPYFPRGYKMPVEINLWDALRLDRAARWGRAFDRAHPEDFFSKLGYTVVLIELGAWGEAEELLDRIHALAEAGDDDMRWLYTNQGQWLAYAQGDTEKAIHLAERHIRESLQPSPRWPDLSGLSAVELLSFELLALTDLSSGDPQSALDRYHDARLDPERMNWKNFYGKTIRPAVMYAVLHRFTGQPETADRLLREMLARIADAPVAGRDGKGFTEFTIHAFLGDTDAAIAALKTSVDAGWLPDWWGLEYGAFDKNYAAVLEDARFKNLYGEITGRVTRLRESFRARPDLPEALLLESGLVGMTKPNP